MEHSYDSDHVDPIHDIDERKTVVWLFAWAIGLIISIWLMVQVFHYLVFNERMDKLSRPDPFTMKLQEQDASELAGKDGKKNIEKAIEDYLR